MFDAYQNGGKGLDGKPVTDQKMRAYVAQRRNGFDKADPTWAEWDNRLTQLDFKIGEEKVTLAYQQGKVGAGAVASFYRHQLSTIPQDSAFYRDVAGRAAQWAKAAVGAARASGARRLTAALDGKQAKVQKTWDNYSQLEAYLTEAAKRAGLIAGNQTLTDADATDLQSFFNAGVAGPHGTKITFSDWQRATLDAYRGFDAQININKQLNRGTKELTKQKQSFLDQVLVRVNTVDDRAKYEIARDAFEKAIGDAKGDPRAILDAASSYAATLGKIKDTALASKGSDQADPEFVGGLTNEITALTTGKSNGGSTVYDLQSTTTEATPSSDLDSTAEAIAKAQGDVKALANGDAYFGQDKFGGEFSVHYYPPGAKLDPFGNNGLDQGSQPAVVSVNGVPTQVILKGQPVRAFGLKDANGNAVTTVPINGRNVPIANLTASQIAALAQQGYQKTNDGATIGFVYTDASGKLTKFGVVQNDGSLAFTGTNPFGNALTPGDDGFVLFTGTQTPSGSDKAVPDLAQVQDLTNYFLKANGGSTGVVLADESVTPKDLLALAANSKNPVEANALTAEADKRQKNADAERQYMNQGTEGKRSTGPQISQASINGLIVNQISGLREAVLSATKPTDQLYDQPPVPQFGPLAAPSFKAPVAPAGNQTPQTFAPAAPPPTLPPVPVPHTAASAAAAAGKPPKPPMSETIDDQVTKKRGTGFAL